MNECELMAAIPGRTFSPDTDAPGEGRERLLRALLLLDEAGYDFVPPTPATQRRQMTRVGRQRAASLIDVLGWSLPVEPGVIEPALENALIDAGVLTRTEDDRLKPLLRASRVEGLLFWHSPYPTRERDAVFLGPDTYRFAQFILARMPDNPKTILDYGAGAGVGGILAARRVASALLTIADINPLALYLASINAEHAGVEHQVVSVSRPAEFEDASFDLIVSHPPFMIDSEHRLYRDGGDLYGARLSLQWLVEGTYLLAPGGRLIMHTGSSVVMGQDVLKSAIADASLADNIIVDYRELDPDIFGNELGKMEYAEVERIAAVGIVAQSDI